MLFGKVDHSSFAHTRASLSFQFHPHSKCRKRDVCVFLYRNHQLQLLWKGFQSENRYLHAKRSAFRQMPKGLFHRSWKMLWKYPTIWVTIVFWMHGWQSLIQKVRDFCWSILHLGSHLFLTMRQFVLMNTPWCCWKRVSDRYFYLRKPFVHAFPNSFAWQPFTPSALLRVFPAQRVSAGKWQSFAEWRGVWNSPQSYSFQTWCIPTTLICNGP